ncbi:hypothetical protein C8Q76DRAFT_688612 [Earliella scabrosa]|nr:hypothetical protein C8Q76DRAFT_688612 [Earliella scabrosa]
MQLFASPLWRSNPRKSNIAAVSFSPDGAIVVTLDRPALALLCRTGLVGVWKLLDNYLPPSPKMEFDLQCTGLTSPPRSTDRCLAFSSTSNLLAASRGGKIRIWTVETNKVCMRGGIDPNHNIAEIAALHFITNVSGCYSSSSILLIAYKIQGTIVEFDVDTGSILRKVPLGQRIVSATFLRDSTLVLQCMGRGLEILRLGPEKIDSICSIPLVRADTRPMYPVSLEGGPLIVCNSNENGLLVLDGHTGAARCKIESMGGMRYTAWTSVINSSRYLVIASMVSVGTYCMTSIEDQSRIDYYKVVAATTLHDTPKPRYGIEVWTVTQRDSEQDASSFARPADMLTPIQLERLETVVAVALCFFLASVILAYCAVP